MKKCRSCGSLKPVDEFHRNPNTRDGRLSKCRTCVREYDRQHYLRNRETIREQQRLRNLENPIPARERAAKWARENRDRKNAWQREWNRHHREERAEAWNRYIEQPGKREERAERMAAYHDQPGVRIRRAEASRRWRQKNRLKRSEAENRRRAQKLATTVETLDPAMIWERCAGICHICGIAADPIRWEMDHAVPLSRGGSHTYGNVLVSHPRCNRAKYDRLRDEMRPDELARLTG